MLSHCAGLGLGLGRGEHTWELRAFILEGGAFKKKSRGPRLLRYIIDVSMATARVKEKSSNVVLTLFFSLMMYYSNYSATSGRWDVK